jgi:lipoyl(octanoyl) transferase
MLSECGAGLPPCRASARRVEGPETPSGISACRAEAQPPKTQQGNDLGRMPYSEALDIQHRVAGERKQGLGTDQLFFVEHPHTVTIGRNGKDENVLASESILQRAGIEFHTSDRGGDVTYHGPGQVVGYPVMDLREWKRDVGAFVRGIEQVLIDTLVEFGIVAGRVPKLTGVWVGEGAEQAKIAAIGVHLSRWVSTHGWALNVTTDLRYFQYIVPCGLAKPVTSMERLGVRVRAEEVKEALARHFGRIFDFVLTGDFA